jgi:enterochelin esterase-like enzyme
MPLRRVVPRWLRRAPEVLLLLAAAYPVQRPVRAASSLTSQRFSVEAPKGREQAIAIWAPPADENDKLPVVVAFHGKGESVLGPTRGYAAWVERYGLSNAYNALLTPPLSAAAFGGLVREKELNALNAELKEHAFRGVLAVGVYTPDLLSEANDSEALARYASWVADVLVPKVQKTFPVASSAPRQVGVDGVSLGGMVALEVGLRHPEVFGAVGSMQPAIRGREATLAALAAEARAKHHQQIRLLSSDADPLLPVTRTLSSELRKRHVAHELLITPGGHDYAFNRGPGAIELLHFHDRALREPTP